MNIQFDNRKATSNLRKHGVSFEEAATALLDTNALVSEDGDAEGEQRLVLLGLSSQGRLLTVCSLYMTKIIHQTFCVLVLGVKTTR